MSSFSFNIFASYHSWISLMDICVLDIASLVDMVNEVYNWQSSAYMWCFRPCFLTMSPRGKRYIVKRIVPKSDPCGTPHNQVTVLDFTPFVNTDCFRWDRYDRNQLRAVPRRLKLCNLDNNISWSVVSKAALKSNKSKITYCLSSTALSISPWIRTRAVSVLWYFHRKIGYTHVDHWLSNDHAVEL